MQTLFNSILANVSEELTIGSALITMLAAIVLGGIIAFTYYLTQEDAHYQQSMAVTLFMLPVILSIIILFVGSNVARAFSLAGTLSIIRFRSAPGDPKDIGFIFFAIAGGLACGVGLYGYGLVFVAILCIVLIAAEKCGLFRKKHAGKILRITVPEDLNYQEVLEEPLKAYTNKYTLTRVRTTDMGALFELTYFVALKDEKDTQALFDALRCRNGNLQIVLMDPPVLA